MQVDPYSLGFFASFFSSSAGWPSRSLARIPSPLLARGDLTRAEFDGQLWQIGEEIADLVAPPASERRPLQGQCREMVATHEGVWDQAEARKCFWILHDVRLCTRVSDEGRIVAAGLAAGAVVPKAAKERTPRD